MMNAWTGRIPHVIVVVVVSDDFLRGPSMSVNGFLGRWFTHAPWTKENKKEPFYKIFFVLRTEGVIYILNVKTLQSLLILCVLNRRLSFFLLRKDAIAPHKMAAHKGPAGRRQQQSQREPTTHLHLERKGTAHCIGSLVCDSTERLPLVCTVILTQPQVVKQLANRLTISMSSMNWPWTYRFRGIAIVWSTCSSLIFSCRTTGTIRSVCIFAVACGLVRDCRSPISQSFLSTLTRSFSFMALLESCSWLARQILLLSAWLPTLVRTLRVFFFVPHVLHAHSVISCFRRHGLSSCVCAPLKLRWASTLPIVLV